jgi:hypothetical protein
VGRYLSGYVLPFWWSSLGDEVGDCLANFVVGDDLREPPTFHDEMEKRLKMDF